MGEWVDGWVGVKAILRIAYSNKKALTNLTAIFYMNPEKLEFP